MNFNPFFQKISPLLFLALTAPAQAAWDEKYYNPAPLEDDIILPMPCEGSMVFRKVALAQNSFLDDKQITLGQDSEEWGYIEQSRPAYISGSFTEKNHKRYYLIAKYELTELQYQSVMADSCPKPSMKLRLPAVSYSWMNAVQFSDTYNLWLRQHAAEQLPIEDGEKAFVRLPTEEEWEFAARGGSAVDSAAFRDARYPMPEGMNEYEWFSGSQSSNGKLQVVGLLKANPLGLYDILGNANEMMLEPFRVNKLNRLHGQAGGIVVRGGNYQTAQSSIRTAARLEQPYYQNDSHTQAKTTGMRFVLVAPTLTSRDRVNHIAAEWKQLGRGTEHEGTEQAVQTLQNLSTTVVDESLKKQLKDLENELRASNEKQAEARDQAILASLNLGAFLCTKLKDDGRYTQTLQRNYDNICSPGEEIDDHCPQRAEKLQEQHALLSGVKRYYASSLIDSALLYGSDLIKKQVPILYENLESNKQISNLKPFVKIYWQHQENYLKNQQIDTDKWLDQCIAAN